jgi:hypothetical protein
MAKSTKRPVPATQFPGEKPVEESTPIEPAPTVEAQVEPAPDESPDANSEAADANPESTASETEPAAADPDVIVITGDSTNPPAAKPESLEFPIIEPEPVVDSIGYHPDGPDNAAGAPKGVHLEHLTVPVKRSVGYAPTAISLNLTGAQARMLANIAEGLTACGEKLAHPSDAINLILDHLADND